MPEQKENKTEPKEETKTEQKDGPQEETGIVGSAKSLLGRFVGGGEEPKEESKEESKDKTSESFTSKASKGVSGIFGKVSGANRGTSGHYKKVAENQDAESKFEGNVISANDNSNVNYSSMVDPYVTDEDVQKKELRSETQKLNDKTHTSVDEAGEEKDDSNTVANVPGL